MSINFDETANPAAREIIEKCFGKPAADDGKSFLMNEMRTVDRGTMSKIARAAKQPPFMEIHGEGDTKTLADGSKHEVTAAGWRKVDENAL